MVAALAPAMARKPWKTRSRQATSLLENIESSESSDAEAWLLFSSRIT